MSTYLGRLVDRAVGPPERGVAPRLAPVFPLARSTAPEPEPVPAESSPRPTRDVLPPPAGTSETRATERPSPAARELREVHIELPARQPREAVAPGDARAETHEPPRTEIRTHERAFERSLVRREVEQAEPARALATTRVVRQPVPATRRERASAPEPRIEVRIGRVEVRRPPLPEPVEWPASTTPVQPAATGFGELAAARRYVDRSWS